MIIKCSTGQSLYGNWDLEFQTFSRFRNGLIHGLRKEGEICQDVFPCNIDIIEFIVLDSLKYFSILLQNQDILVKDHYNFSKLSIYLFLATSLILFIFKVQEDFSLFYSFRCCHKSSLCNELPDKPVFMSNYLFKLCFSWKEEFLTES